MRCSARTRFPTARLCCSMPCARTGWSDLPPSDGLSRLLFLECHRHSRIRGQADLLSLDVSNQPEVDEVRVALVLAFAAVTLRQSDATVGDTVDGADVHTVRTDDFHVPGDFVRGHLTLLVMSLIALKLHADRQAKSCESPCNLACVYCCGTWP